MKKILVIMGLVAATVAAFAQGKVQVQNDGTRLVTIVAARNGDPTGPVAVTGPLPSGISLVFGLYAGTSSTHVSLVSTYPINPVGGNPGSIVAGQIASSHCILPFAGGSVDYFEVKVWDGAFASYEACLANGPTYIGSSGSIFSMTPGTGIAYPGINNGGGTTWAAGPIEVYGPAFCAGPPRPRRCGPCYTPTPQTVGRRAPLKPWQAIARRDGCRHGPNALRAFKKELQHLAR